MRDEEGRSEVFFHKKKQMKSLPKDEYKQSLCVHLSPRRLKMRVDAARLTYIVMKQVHRVAREAAFGCGSNARTKSIGTTGCTTDFISIIT